MANHLKHEDPERGDVPPAPLPAQSFNWWHINKECIVVIFWNPLGKLKARLQCLGRLGRWKSTFELPRVRQQIEDWPAGYPRFAALLGAHPSFHVCRRFVNLRLRMLLLKQDRVTVLEKRLDDIDRAETRTLHLASNRLDANDERWTVLADIDVALANYDEQVRRNHRILGYQDASERALRSLANWVEGTSSMARDETAYLERGSDLLCANPSVDDVMMHLEGLIGRGLAGFGSTFRGTKNVQFDVSRDENVWIWSEGSFGKISRAILVCLVTALLVIPIVIICNAQSIALRIFVVFVGTSTFILALSGCARSRANEIFLAGATYATVLVVFVASNGCNT